MNAVRTKYALTDKLSIADATGYIKPIDSNDVVDDKISWYVNQVDGYVIDGGMRFVANQDNHSGTSGVYYYYDKTKVVPGKRYMFNALIRGTMVMRMIGEETNLTWNSKDLVLDPNNWKILSCGFIAKNNIIVYGGGNKADWFELKNYSISKLGGVVKAVLSALHLERRCLA